MLEVTLTLKARSVPVIKLSSKTFRKMPFPQTFRMIEGSSWKFVRFCTS